MRILILEDEQIRKVFFSKKFGQHHSITFASTVEEAIAACEQEKNFNIFFLDHDLTEIHYKEDRQEGTGTEFVRWLITNYTNFNKALYYIHSMNPMGGKRMHDILLDADCEVELIPFIALIRRLQ